MIGVKRCGIASLDLAGAAPPFAEFVEPHGIRQLTLTRNLPDPYSD